MRHEGKPLLFSHSCLVLLLALLALILHIHHAALGACEPVLVSHNIVLQPANTSLKHLCERSSTLEVNHVIDSCELLLGGGSISALLPGCSISLSHNSFSSHKLTPVNSPKMVYWHIISVLTSIYFGLYTWDKISFGICIHYLQKLNKKIIGNTIHTVECFRMMFCKAPCKLALNKTLMVFLITAENNLCDKQEFCKIIFTNLHKRFFEA